MATLLVEPLCIASVANVLICQTAPPDEIKAPLMAQSIMGRKAPGGLSGVLEGLLLYDRALAMEPKRMELRFKDRNLMLRYVCMRLRDACFKRYGGEKVDGAIPNA